MAPKRKAKTQDSEKPAKATKVEKKILAKDDANAGASGGGSGVVIEAWATKLEKLLKESNPDISVIINPEKPRKGCFEVRGPAGDTYVSLLDMPRPFKKLKELDIDELASEIAKKLDG